MNYSHVTVLKTQMINALNLKKGDIAIDCTAGGGGHTAGLLSVVGPTGKVFAVDQDELSIAHLKQAYEQEIASGNLVVVHDRFSQIKNLADRHGINGKIGGICADIGISSEHVDNPERGFSFIKDGPLAMTMSSHFATKSAADIINSYSFEELVRVFKDYGEERQSRKIAAAIIKTRELSPFTRTSQLAELVDKITPFKYKTLKHPATRIFQALRIEVNGELDELQTLLQEGFSILSNTGRMAIISFHSLEDRLVKHFFRKMAGLEKDAKPRFLPIIEAEDHPGKIIKPFPITPDDDEINQNIRARSAKLRVIEKTSSLEK